MDKMLSEQRLLAALAKALKEDPNMVSALLERASAQNPHPAQLACDVTLGVLYERWLEEHARPQLVRTEFRNQRSIYLKHVAPVFGGRIAAQIRLQEIVAFLRGKEREGLSNSSVKRIRNSFSRVYRWAIYERGYPLQNPLDGYIFRFQQVEERKTKYIGKNTLNRFFKAAKERRSPYLHYYEILHSAGLRPSEGLALRKEDIQGNFLHIKRAITMDGLKDTKSRHGQRVIPIHTALKKALDAQLQEMDPESPWLFSLGWKFPSMLRVSRDFRSVKKATAVYHKVTRSRSDGQRKTRKFLVQEPVAFRLYDFRHDFATRLFKNGVNINDICRLMGHSEISVTLNYYAECVPENLWKIRDLLADDESLGEAEEEKTIPVLVDSSPEDLLEQLGPALLDAEGEEGAEEEESSVN